MSSNAIALAKRIRRHCLLMSHKAKASHIGSALSMVDILAVLYSDVMEYDLNDVDGLQFDKFILSKGHACMAIYAALAECDFISKDDLLSYGNANSWLMNHASHKVTGVEFSTGSLGHGLPFAVGKALANKISKIASKIYVLLGDGELAEGSNWEALLFASHEKLNNLVVIIDANNLQSLDTVDNTLRLEPIGEKLHAFGCDVTEVDGHNTDDLLLALSKKCDRPHVLVAKTIKGKGVSFMENKVEWHYRFPDKELMEIALNELEGQIA